MVLLMFSLLVVPIASLQWIVVLQNFIKNLSGHREIRNKNLVLLVSIEAKWQPYNLYIYIKILCLFLDPKKNEYEICGMLDMSMLTFLEI